MRGALNILIPDEYVQFFVEDGSAVDEAYTLGTDAVIPVGVASIAADGTITETSDKVAGNDMTGYAYQGGYLFSGKLNGSYAYSGSYYFAKTKTADLFEGTPSRRWHVTSVLMVSFHCSKNI